MRPEISVIVSVYNRPGHLYWCLKGLSHQSFREFEVIVSDDGSKGDVKDVVDAFRGKFKGLRHIWGLHVPFGKVLAINRSARAALGSLLIFIDADCMPDVKLLETYMNARKNGLYFYTGGAFFVDRDTSSEILSCPNMPYDEALGLAESSIPRNQRTEMLKKQIKANLYRFFTKKRPKGYGGNIAIEKAAFWKAGGYDEAFRMRGQDTDLVSRMVLEGVKFVPLYTKAKVYHLYHEKVKENPNERKIRRELLKWKNYRKLYLSGIKVSSTISSRLHSSKT